MVQVKVEKKRKESPVKVRYLCICESLKPALVICRIFGMFPITIVHEKKNNCVFVKNRNWFIYSVVVTIFCFIRVVLATDLFDILEIGRKKSLHPIIASLNDITYSLYIALLTAINIYRSPKYVETLNKFTILVKDNLYCQSSRRAVLAVQYGIVLTFVIIIFVKFGAISYVQFSDEYETSNFDFKIYSNAIVQTEIFTVYVMFIAMSSVLMGMFGCYEKIAIAGLNYKPIHPLQDVDETNNSAEFMGLVDYALCKEMHSLLRKIRKLPLTEIIEYLRCLHEEICVVMFEMNQCLNPQFLVHVTVELVVLVLNWYAVIMYVAYVFVNPVARTLNLLNIFFVVVHTLGLFVFLKQAQQLQNLARGLINILLEYSTRADTSEEHQQMRIFIEKMKGQRPLTASGVFDIDLGIAGPVCANILTYVLVALQFDIPKT